MKDEKSLLPENITPVFEEIKNLVINSRNRVYAAVNIEMLNLYWNIGKVIMEIQQGNERATYGKAVLESLSKKLTNEFGKGFSVDNLEKMRKMYITFPNSATLSRKFKLVTLSRINKNRRRKQKKFLFKRSNQFKMECQRTAKAKGFFII